MTPRTSPAHATSLETRPSLLRRLTDGDDADGWHEFYRTYSGLIRFFAERAGLTPDEAEEVVQETAIGVARGLPNYIYNPKVCRFKTWLLNLTRWRIQDQLRRRSPELGVKMPTRSGNRGDGDETATIDRVPDPCVPEFGAEWEIQWQKNTLSRALERIRERIDERQFQIFDLCVTQEWPPQKVAVTLGISAARVYLVKHRVSAMLKREVRHLGRKAERH